MTGRKEAEAADLISNYLDVALRYVRSIEIERDLGDPGATDGYVLTPAVLFAAQTLAGGLRKDSTQRAWRITGPYGAGKSAFGLFLGNVVARSGAGKRLLAQLEAEAPEVHASCQGMPRYLPIALTGSRVAFGASLIARLRQEVERISTRRPPKLLAYLRQLEGRSGLSDEKVAESLSRFVEYVVSATEHQGVLILIDEMGKYLEYAALHPQEADAHIFQRIAEMAAGGSKHPLAIVGFLHQNFADYAEGYGERAQEEWSKVAQRFEDIPFDEALEQYGFLLSKAMQYKGDVLRRRGIEKRARELYGHAIPSEKKGGRTRALVESAPNLYPIHPSAFLALAAAVKRFGQNQRSLSSFLLSSEAHGLQQFTRTTSLGTHNWYRLPQLYDYLASLDGITFRQGDRSRKWDLLRDTLAHGPMLEPVELAVLKSIGLLNVLDPVPHLGTNAKAISAALADVEDDKAVRDALESLVEKGVVYFRRAQGDYCLWKHSSVDLQSLYEEAARQTRSTTTLDDLLAVIGEGRALIAQRHYQQTGTLRAFRVRFVSLAQFGAAKHEPVQEYDGEVIVVLLDPGASVAEVAPKVSEHSLANDPARMIALRKIEPGDLKVATEIRIYERIRGTCKELRVDEFARREVDQALDRVHRQLEDRLSRVAALGRSFDANTTWMYQCKPVEIESRRDLSKRLSTVCETVYAAAPVLRNELINRHKLSSAISLARLRLVGAMLAKHAEPGLGLTGMPPERAIYLSMFQDTGLHRKEKGVTGFYAPRAGADENRWGPAWNGLRQHLVGSGQVSFDAAITFLKRAPYGMRDGPALLLIFALVLSERRSMVLFERGTYVVNFTEDHVQRLVKSPANFALHLQAPINGVRGLFATYASALDPIKEKHDLLTDAHGVVSCLYRWHTRLSEFAHQTGSASKAAKEVRSVLRRAMDPVDLLTKGLPAVFGVENLAAAKKQELEAFAHALRAALEEIDQADETLRQKILFILNEAFGTQGSIVELRRFLRESFGLYKDVLGDSKLKAALTRAIDQEVDDRAWLESVAGLLGERSLALWSDETLEKFQTDAIDFAGKLRRWIGLMLQLKSKPGGTAPSLVSIYVTGKSGMEHALLVPDTLAKRASNEELKKALRAVIAMNPEEAPLVLAQALAELLSTGAAEVDKRGNSK